MPIHPPNPTPPTSSPLSRRSFLRRSALVTTVAATGPALLTACGGAAETGANGNPAVTFPSLLPLETLGMAPEMFAYTGGYFTEHGLDVTLQPVKGSPQAMQTVLAGTGPITRVGQIDLMTAVTEREQPLVVVGTIVRRSAIRYVYRKSDPLAAPEDFVGKTVGVPSEGGTSSLVVDLVLSSSGLNPDDAPRQVVGLTPGTFNLVEQGRIAGYAVSGDTANIILAQHPDAGVFDPGTVVKADSQVYVATRETIEQDPGTLRRFLLAIRDAVRAMVDEESAGFATTIETLRGEYSFAALDDDAIARKSLSDNIAGWVAEDGETPLLVTDEARWKAGYDELTAAGIIPSGADPAAWVDNGLLESGA